MWVFLKSSRVKRNAWCLERLELGVQTEARKHSWGSDQEACLSSLAPGSLRDSFQSCLRDMVVLLPECGNCFRKG